MQKRIDPIMAVVVNAVGALVLFTVVALLFFLGRESQHAFKQVYPFGFRFAVTKPIPDRGYNVEQDVYASILTANIEGQDGIDQKEETMPMPRVSDLEMDTENKPVGATGVFIPFIAGDAKTPLPSGPLDPSQVDAMMLFRDDWRAAKPAEQGERFVLFAFGSSQLQGDTMTLRWGPDASYLPELTPYSLKLRLLRAPDGVSIDPIEIDLKKEPSGAIELPAWRAATDEDRLKGYQFEIVATPGPSTAVAAFTNMMKTDWAPTLNYARYGIVPLILSTLIITLIAVLIAAPVSLGLALYISEVAPARIKDWLKPTVELLASIPTVVLAYFGLMTVAPFLLSNIGAFVGMESTRSLLTAAVMMGILLIPTIATVAEDTLANLPRHLRDGADALGLTPRETIRKVLLPAAKSGLIGAVLLGLARAFGETMLVWLLSGGTVRMPTQGLNTLGSATKGIPDTIGIEMGNVTMESAHYGHLFFLGLVLFLITLAINLTGYRLAKKSSWTA